MRFQSWCKRAKETLWSISEEQAAEERPDPVSRSPAHLPTKPHGQVQGEYGISLPSTSSQPACSAAHNSVASCKGPLFPHQQPGPRVSTATFSLTIPSSNVVSLTWRPELGSSCY